ncbi:MAG: hypothetical protein ACFFB3_20245 [Candidatus Hodarchaeota archaeon]
MSKSLSESCKLHSNQTKEVQLEELASVPDGQIITVEGYLVACNLQLRLEEGNSAHTMQFLSLTSKYPPIDENVISVFLWDKDELQAKKGEKIRITNGIFREGKIHLLHSAILEQIKDPETKIESKKKRNASELAKKAESEIERLNSFYRQIMSTKIPNSSRKGSNQVEKTVNSPNFPEKSVDGDLFSSITNLGPLRTNFIQDK